MNTTNDLLAQLIAEKLKSKLDALAEQRAEEMFREMAHVSKPAPAPVSKPAPLLAPKWVVRSNSASLLALSPNFPANIAKKGTKQQALWEEIFMILAPGAMSRSELTARLHQKVATMMNPNNISSCISQLVQDGHLSVSAPPSSEVKA